MNVNFSQNPKQNVFSSFQKKLAPMQGKYGYNSKSSHYSTLRYKRNHRIEEHDNNTKLKIAAGAAFSTIIPLIYFAKKQMPASLQNEKNFLKKTAKFFNINYGLKEIIALSAASIGGGVVSGIFADKKNSKKRKINEGVFQFMNATVPTMLVGGALKLLEDNIKYKNSKPVRIAAISTAMFAGMPLAAFISNLINDPKDKEPDRKLTLKDSLVNMDDALGALVIAKVPVFGLDKLLPAIFAWCGYRAGQSN